MGGGRGPRFVLYGLVAGALLGFGAGCHRAAANNARAAERLRAQDPAAHVDGHSFLAEVAVGLVWAVPGGLLGAAAGAGCRRWWPTGPSHAEPGAAADPRRQFGSAS